MNNEPVAWMQTWQNQDGELKQTVNIEQIGKNDIPLYTHPVKEPTDEEILEIGENCDNYWDNCDLIDFARAILHKTQEADKIESLGTVNIGGVHFRNGKEVK